MLYPPGDSLGGFTHRVLPKQPVDGNTVHLTFSGEGSVGQCLYIFSSINFLSPLRDPMVVYQIISPVKNQINEVPFTKARASNLLVADLGINPASPRLQLVQDIACLRLKTGLFPRLLRQPILDFFPPPCPDCHFSSLTELISLSNELCFCFTSLAVRDWSLGENNDKSCKILILLLSSRVSGNSEGLRDWNTRKRLLTLSSIIAF